MSNHRIDRYFYGASIGQFLDTPEETIHSRLTEGHLSSINSLEYTQDNTWHDEICIMKQVLAPYRNRGSVYFEYSIPRMGRRVDVSVLIDGIVFVLEFKVGAKIFNKQDKDQTWDYALDLKNFHEGSHDRIIIPILIATNARNGIINFTQSGRNDNVYEPIAINAEQLSGLFAEAIAQFPKYDCYSDYEWATSRYAPTPTIVEAAAALYNSHGVEEITRNDAENLNQTCSFINNLIMECQAQHKKAICFVTGVPGAGKTLVGLNIATQQGTRSSMEKLAIYLSGNFPLVQVLTEALARDENKRLKESGNKKAKIGDSRTRAKQFIQMVHHYRTECLTGAKIENGQIVADEKYFLNPENADKQFPPVDHVAIFDEAQRAWTKEALAKFMSKKKKIQNFPMSEPDFLVSCLDRHQDWALIICLVGGGQEINSGEAGIKEWLDSLNRDYPHWHIYMSDQLTDKEYAAGEAIELIKAHVNVHFDHSLHLATSMRSFRAENLSNFVAKLLDCDFEAASKILPELNNYPLLMTRDVEKAKTWIKTQSRGTERYGIVASSNAYRLRPIGIDVKHSADVVHWFLDDNQDVRSSYFLEDVATEFDVQGLELDWTCLVWDADFRYNNGTWTYHEFKGDHWTNVSNKTNQEFQKNAYRVLLTRARQGMVIVIPEGAPDDHTRLPKFYDSTYNYLKSLGIPEL